MTIIFFSLTLLCRLAAMLSGIHHRHVIKDQHEIILADVKNVVIAGVAVLS